MLIPQNDQHRLCLPVIAFSVLPRENPPHAKQTFRFKVQFFFLREAGELRLQPKLVTTLLSLPHRIVIVDLAGDGDR